MMTRIDMESLWEAHSSRSGDDGQLNLPKRQRTRIRREVACGFVLIARFAKDVV